MPRQPNGNPSIFLGADGDYHLYYTAGRKDDGSPDRRHIRGKKPSIVQDKYQKALDRARRGAKAPAKKAETVEEWLTYWLEFVVRPARAYNTWTGRKSAITKHVIPRLGQWKLDSGRHALQPEHLETMYAALADPVAGPGLSSSYRLGIHLMLHKAFADAVKRGRMGINVCDLIDAPLSRPKKIDAHTLEEAQAIIKAAAVDKLSARWLIGILIGLRQGEVLGLRWDRVKLDSKHPTIQVKAQLQRRTWEHGCGDPRACVVAMPRAGKKVPNGKCRTEPCAGSWVHGCGDSCGKGRPQYCPSRKPAKTVGCGKHARACPPPCPADCAGHARWCPKRTGGGLVDAALKGDKSERDVAMDAVLVEALRTWRERQIQRGHFKPTGYVFTAKTGAPLDPRRDHLAWRALLVQAGVDPGRLHMARHDAGTLMLASGTDIRVVQAVLGHSKITVTEQYVDVAMQLKQQAVDRVAAALFDGSLAALLQPPTGTATRSATSGDS